MEVIRDADHRRGKRRLDEVKGERLSDRWSHSGQSRGQTPIDNDDARRAGDIGIGNRSTGAYGNLEQIEEAARHRTNPDGHCVAAAHTRRKRRRIVLSGQGQFRRHACRHSCEIEPFEELLPETDPAFRRGVAPRGYGHSRRVNVARFQPGIDAAQGHEALGQQTCADDQPTAKTWKGLGPGVMEIVESHDGHAYRAVYTVRFEKAVYVPHAFQKKSPYGIRTAKRDVDLVAERLKTAGRDYEERPD
jgi:phage-related protein